MINQTFKIILINHTDKNINSKAGISSSWVIIKLLTVVFTLIIQTYHCLDPKVQCVKSPLGERVNPSLVWTKQSKCFKVWKHLYIAVHGPAQSLCISLRHFSESVSVLMDASQLAPFLSLSSSTWFCLGFFQTFHCCCPLIRSFYSGMTLKAHLLSSASHMCRHFLFFLFVLFLHKHFCSSEWAGIVCALCFLRRACCRSTKLITPAQWCRAVSAFQRGNWRE